MYGHPFEPYDVQRQFMASMYDSLSAKRVAIFESPTGTGKTLSLLCPSVAWLRDSARRQLESDMAKIDKAGGPDWMVAKAKQRRQIRYDAEFAATKQLVETAEQWAAKRQKIDNTDTDLELDEIEILKPKHRIIFASRTHSQLVQVADALRSLKTRAPRFVQLGSRQQLCVHPQVSKLKSAQQINDSCADLQKGNKCEFRHHVAPVRNLALGQIMDIEDLARAGRAVGGCSYYAAREAANYAEVVAVPYALLLVARNREALGLDVDGAVVIIDEAHNLIDALSALLSQTLTRKVVRRAYTGIKACLSRVGDRLSLQNRQQVLQIGRLLQSVDAVFTEMPANTKPGTKIDPRQLLAKNNADTMDLMAISQYIHDSHLVFKIDSYLTEEDGEDTKQLMSLGTAVDFVMVATDPLAEGKLFVDVDEVGGKVLRYLVLDTSISFREIVDQAKVVVLAGGTMEPVAEFKYRLLPYVGTDELAVNTYGHIIPKSQLLVLPVAEKLLKFTFAERGKPETVEMLGRTIIDIASEVPNGMVVFFPGYAYLEQVVGQWKKGTVYTELIKLKRVFVESKKIAQNDVFTKFGTSALSLQGGLLLAVVGGKLSEGINFSDGLARAVVIVGVPFPNAFSAEMVAKCTYIETSAHQRGRNADEAKEEAREYYENLAMRAVNQSVGRAVRHARDYAAIYLVDERFATQHIQQKLSKWVRESIELCTDIKKQTQEFFTRNKS